MSTGHVEILQILPFKVCVISAPTSSALFEEGTYLSTIK